MSDIFMVHFVDLVLGLTLSPWTLTVPLCMAAWTPAEGEPQVIGSLQPIIAAPGDDVILPCHLEPDFNVEGLTVEWSKPDLKPDPSDRLSRVDYVHLYRNRREVPDMKLPSYVGRTELFTDGLKCGNISLKIMNVTLADEGRYKCFIPKLKSKVKESIVELVVDPNSVKTVTTETPLHPRNLQTPDPNDETNVEGGRSSRSRLISAVVVCVVLILVVGVGAGYLLKHKCPKKDLPKDDVAPNKQTTSSLGALLEDTLVVDVNGDESVVHFLPLLDLSSHQFGDSNQQHLQTQEDPLDQQD